MSMDKMHKQTERKLSALERRMKTEYRIAYEELSEKLTKYLEEFSVEDAKKKALYEAGKLTKQEYTKWRNEQMLLNRRWRSLRDKIAKELVKVDNTAISLVNSTATGVFVDNANYGAYEVETGFGLSTDFTLYNEQTVELLFDETGLTKTINISKDFEWNKKNISSAVLQGILQGEAIPKIAERLETATGMSYKAAVRSARTMITGAENAGRLQGYRDLAERGLITEKIWMATLSPRTRDSHRLVDMETVGIDESFSNGLMYPGDPSGEPAEVYNCRCTMIAKTVHATDDALRRWSELDSDISYEEWKNGK